MENGHHQADNRHSNVAYVTLFHEIRAGRLGPGDRLREIELADRLGVSRTPVREAIRQLEADGLVVHLPRQGAAIRYLDYAEIIELYEMRTVLEGTVARLAARAASDVEINELSVINSELSKATSDEGALELNRLFHSALLDAAKNRFLNSSMRILRNSLMILGPAASVESNRFDRAIAEHQSIIEALQAREGDRAEVCMRAHIEAGQAARLRTLHNAAYPGEPDLPDPV